MNKQIHGVPVKEYFTNLASKEVSVEEDNPSFRCVKSWIHVYVCKLPCLPPRESCESWYDYIDITGFVSVTLG